jgi:hypothetical protein
MTKPDRPKMRFTLFALHAGSALFKVLRFSGLIRVPEWISTVTEMVIPATQPVGASSSRPTFKIFTSVRLMESTQQSQRKKTGLHALFGSLNTSIASTGAVRCVSIFNAPRDALASQNDYYAY